MESGVTSWSSSPRLTAGSSCVRVNNCGIRPKESTKSMDADGFPTTFVEADADSFKQVVQMLTSHGTTTAAGSKALPGPKKTSFKLNERRRSLKNLKMIRPPAHSKHPLSPEILSPSVLEFPSLALISPIAPLTLDPFQRATTVEKEELGIPEKGFYLHSSPAILSPSVLEFPSLALISPIAPLTPDPFQRAMAVEEEELGIPEKGFYLHSSPRSAVEPPRLLSLFPVTSLRMSFAGSSS